MSSIGCKSGEGRTPRAPLLPHQLKEALTILMGREVLGENEVDDLVHFVLNFFGYEDYLLDNLLEQRERDVFYMLEEMGVLKALREETNIYRGKGWRIHYWVLNRDFIDAVLNRDVAVEDEPLLPELLYRRLDEEVWERRGPHRVAE